MVVLVGLIRAAYVSYEDQKCFKVLGATLDDSPAEIKAKYRQLALAHHPDRIRSGSQLLSENGVSMEKINDAYECVTRFIARAEEPTLSKRAETITETALDLWESTPAARREELVALINEYFSSEDVMDDVSFLVGKFILNNEADALQRLLAVLVCGLILNVILCTVGTFALLYITYRLVRWVFRCAWWLTALICLFVGRCASVVLGKGQLKEE